MTKTTLLYMQDDYMRTFQARAVSASLRNLTLDRTAFYPTGGHQACDLGKISRGAQNLAYVTGVKKVGPAVIHEIKLVSGSFAEGDEVEGVVDWGRRYYHMQLHTAQHIFSRCFLNRFAVTTWRSDLSTEGGLIVMERPVTFSEVATIESDTNEMISRALPVHRVLHGENAHVHIGEFSLDECGGTHVQKTSEIVLFKVYRIDEKNVYYQVDERAISTALSMANCSLEATEALSLDDFHQVPGKVSEMAREIAVQRDMMSELQDRMTQLRVQRASETCQKANGIEVLLLDLRHLHSKIAKKEVLRLQDTGRVILCIASNSSVIICSSSPSISAKMVMKTLSAQWHIRGGGSDFYAQGGPYPGEVIDPLNELLQLVKAIV